LRAFSATTDFHGYRGSAATAALSTLFGSASGSPVVPLPSHLTAANVRRLVDAMGSYSLAH